MHSEEQVKDIESNKRAPSAVQQIIAGSRKLNFVSTANGSDGGDGYGRLGNVCSPPGGWRAGQEVTCTVDRAEPGGYGVILIYKNLIGFIATENVLQIGQVITARYVCVSSWRILLVAAPNKVHQPIRD